MQNLGSSKNIPEAPKNPPEIHHYPAQKRESRSKSPRKEIPTTFHEGHEKDIPDKKDFMEHNKFEKTAHNIDEHLGGPIQTESTGGSHNLHTQEKGFIDKAKDVISSGIDNVKNFISGQK